MYQISINLIYCLIENANQEGKTLSSIHLVFHAGQGFLPRARQKKTSINFVSNLNFSGKVEWSAECSLYGLPDVLLGILNFLFFLCHFFFFLKLFTNSILIYFEVSSSATPVSSN